MTTDKSEALEKHEKMARKRKLKNYNLWQYATVVLGLLLVISLATKGDFGTATGGSSLGADEAADKAIGYINTYLMQGAPMQATYDEVSEENGMYKMGLKIGDQVFTGYVTKDGKLFFPQAIDLEETPEIPTQQQQPPPQDVPKSDKPKVELFIMSHCPFGVQSLQGMLPAAKLLGDKIDFSVKYVNYAMHGEEEVYEQLNQYCIQEEQNDKLFTYLECFVEAGDGEGCLTEAAIDMAKLEECAARVDEEFGLTAGLEDQSKWSGGRFPPFAIHDAECTEYGIRGSPGLVINGQSVQSARDSASYLGTICSAFNVEPGECGETLSSAAPSPGFGGGTAAASSGGQCG